MPPVPPTLGDRSRNREFVHAEDPDGKTVAGSVTNFPILSKIKRIAGGLAILPHLPPLTSLHCDRSSKFHTLAAHWIELGNEAPYAYRPDALDSKWIG
jgi:hypothetical protein